MSNDNHILFPIQRVPFFRPFLPFISHISTFLNTLFLRKNLGWEPNQKLIMCPILNWSYPPYCSQYIHIFSNRMCYQTDYLIPIQKNMQCYKQSKEGITRSFYQSRFAERSTWNENLGDPLLKRRSFKALLASVRFWRDAYLI